MFASIIDDMYNILVQAKSLHVVGLGGIKGLKEKNLRDGSTNEVKGVEEVRFECLDQDHKVES